MGSLVSRRVGTWVILVFLIVIYLFPFYWMLITSFKTPPEASSWPPTFFPKDFTFDAYKEVWKTFPFPRWFLNSILIAILVTLTTIFITSLAAYSFVYHRFPGQTGLFLLILSSLMIPMHIRMIPSYILVSSLSLLEKYLGIILPQVAANCALGVFWLRQYNAYIPKDLIDAARIDGCSEFRIFSSIILPLTKSAIIALGIFVFLNSWNDFIWPLIVVQSDSMKTLPIGLLDLAPVAGTHKMTWPQRMAGTSIVVLPLMVLFFFFRDLFLKSVAITGLKE